MPKLARRIFAGVGIALAAAGLIALAALWAARQTPDFYRRSLAQPLGEQAVGSERLEQQALALHNQLHREGRFEVRFTEDEINAWLASELPEKFPRLLPAAFSDPRVAMQSGLLRLAVRYQRGNIDTVLSLAAEAYLTEEPNEIAIRISAVRAGLLPVPIGSLLNDIERRATRAGFALRWSEDGGDPVGLVRIPNEIEPKQDDDTPQRFTLEEVRLEAGELVVIGRTDKPTDEVSPRDAPANTAGQSLENVTHQR